MSDRVMTEDPGQQAAAAWQQLVATEAALSAMALGGKWHLWRLVLNEAIEDVRAYERTLVALKEAQR